MSAGPADPLSELTAIGKGRALKTATLSRVNEGIVEVAHSSIDVEQEWDFFCECGRDGCHEYVSLTLDAYSAIHDGGGAVLAPGHHLSQIERAKRLRDEAKALQRQAAHQAKRALRNVGRKGAL